MKKRQRMKMLFWTRYRHYEYTIMLFELKNVFITFQRLINNTLRKYLDDFVITYLNDILIYSDDLETHCSHMHKILKKLNERALYVKSQRAGSKQRKLNFLIMLFDLSKLRRTWKDRCSQKLTFAEMSQESTSLLLRSNRNQLVCSRNTRKAYTWT
jgi:hypothetical protein